jgi:hypothetical protein
MSFNAALRDHLTSAVDWERDEIIALVQSLEGWQPDDELTLIQEIVRQIKARKGTL